MIPVHFGGAPCDMDPLLEIARKHSLWIFEDAAHGVGTLYKGKHVGLFDKPGRLLLPSDQEHDHRRGGDA